MYQIADGFTQEKLAQELGIEAKDVTELLNGTTSFEIDTAFGQKFLQMVIATKDDKAPLIESQYTLEEVGMSHAQYLRSLIAPNTETYLKLIAFLLTPLQRQMFELLSIDRLSHTRTQAILEISKSKFAREYKIINERLVHSPYSQFAAMLTLWRIAPKEEYLEDSVKARIKREPGTLYGFDSYGIRKKQPVDITEDDLRMLILLDTEISYEYRNILAYYCYDYFHELPIIISVQLIMNLDRIERYCLFQEAYACMLTKYPFAEFLFQKKKK